MAVTISADIPEDSISSAAFGLGLDLANVSRSGVVRAALALFQGMSKAEARGYVQPKREKPARLGSQAQDFVTAIVPDELANVGEGVQRAYAIRVGLALAAGMSQKQAESWARMTIRPAGRPRKDESTS
jgi:hypothetical protein